MYAIIAILLPSVLGVKILDYFNRGLSLKNTIYYFLILVLVSNFLNNIFAHVMFDVSENVFGALNDFPIFFSKFVLVSIIINLFLVFLIVVLQRSLKLEIVAAEEKHNEKKKTKKTIKK